MALAIPMAGWAQTVDSNDSQSWRHANDLVGQYLRGHIDLLKWEKAHPRISELSPVPENELPLSTSEAAVGLAWSRRPDFADTLRHFSMQERDRMARGQWEYFEPSLSRRIAGSDELLEFTMQVRKAWLQAAASALTVSLTQAALDAAEVAHELGQRMVSVGNWNKLAQAPQQLALANAQLDLQKARFAARQDRDQLLKLLGLTGQYEGVVFSESLPDVGSSPSKAELEDRLQRLQREYGTALRTRIRGDVKRSYENLLDANAAVQTSNEIVKIHEMVVEETQLHYNGMLKSTWDLLTEVQSLAQARIAALNAHRDAALARIELDWMLMGGGV